MALDVFGITMLHNTVAGGREWFSTLWNNGHTRNYENMSGYDEDDPNLFLRVVGGSVIIGPTGETSVTGPLTKLLVEGPWMNTEITCYCKTVTSIDFVDLSSRSNREMFDVNNNNCGFGRYIERFNHDTTTVSSGKEPMNGTILTTFQDPNSFGGLPVGTYIGLKMITRNDRINNKVLIQGHSDTTGGSGGGTWVLESQWNDDGTLPVTINDQAFVDLCKLTDDENSAMLFCCGNPAETNLKQQWLDPGQHCWIETDDAVSVSYKWYSVREIAPVS